MRAPRAICVRLLTFLLAGGRAGKLNCRGTVSPSCFHRRIAVVVKSRTFSARQLVRLCNEFKTGKRDSRRAEPRYSFVFPSRSSPSCPRWKRDLRLFEIFFFPPVSKILLLSPSFPSLPSSSSCIFPLSGCHVESCDFHARISPQLPRNSSGQ